MSQWGEPNRQAVLEACLPGSISRELAELPVTNDVPDVIGLLLHLPRTGLIVVPTASRPGSYCCTVVKGNEMYPRGGHDIVVGMDEIVRARPLDLDVLIPAARLAAAAVYDRCIADTEDSFNEFDEAFGEYMRVDPTYRDWVGPELPAGHEWRHCSPDYIAEFNDCPVALRRPCRCFGPESAGHDHAVLAGVSDARQ